MHDDLEAEVTRLLEENASEMGAELNVHLCDAVRARRLMDLVDGELHEKAAAAYSHATEQCLELLLAWTELGGIVSFGDEVQALASEPEPEVLDPIEPEPASPEPAPPPPKPPQKPRLQTVDPDWWQRVGRYLSLYGMQEDAEEDVEAVALVLGSKDAWPRFPRQIQVQLIEWCAARARHAQTRGDGRRADWCVRALGRYRHDHDPGWCHGLAQHARPKGSSWKDDALRIEAALQTATAESVPAARKVSAEEHLVVVSGLIQELALAPTDETAEAVRSQLRRCLRDALVDGLSPRDPRLVTLLREHVDDLDGTEFKVLRRAIRALADAEEPETDEVEALGVSWPFWHLTRGRRAVILGGDARERNRARLQEDFEFAELDWVSTEARRNSLQSLRDRVRSGGVDLVIVLTRFVGHDADDVVLKACKEVGCDWVHVDSGYGRNQIRLAIERFHGARASLIS